MERRGVDPDANELGAELYREMVRRTVNDPELAEALSPRGFPIGCKRPVVDSNYFETFNRDNVTLVDLREGGIERITETGIQTAQGHFELDVIVFATGFDAMTGALTRIDIRGRDGVALRDAWADGVRAPTSVSRSVGFPNLFTVSGPGSPSVLANMVVCVEQHVEWIGACLTYLREHGYTHDRAHARGAGRVGRARQRGRPGHDVHRVHLQLVVPRCQHPRQAAGLPALRRRACPPTSSGSTRSRPPATRASHSPDGLL